MAELRYREALNQALQRGAAARRARASSWARTSASSTARSRSPQGLLEEFGEKRVRDTPISENTIVGVGVGAAMTGLRPIVELMTVNFTPARDGPDRQPHGDDPLHVRRPGDGADGGPDAAGRRPPARPDALALPRGDLPARAGDAARRAVHARRREGPAEGRDPRRQPGRLHRARVALRPQGRGPGRRGPHRRLRPGRDPPRGRGRDDRRHLADGAHRAEGGGGARGGARDRRRGDRPAHAAPARPGHDPRVASARPTAA